MGNGLKKLGNFSRKTLIPKTQEHFEAENYEFLPRATVVMDDFIFDGGVIWRPDPTNSEARQYAQKLINMGVRYSCNSKKNIELTNAKDAAEKAALLAAKSLEAIRPNALDATRSIAYSSDEEIIREKANDYLDIEKLRVILKGSGIKTKNMTKTAMVDLLVDYFVANNLTASDLKTSMKKLPVAEDSE